MRRFRGIGMRSPPAPRLLQLRAVLIRYCAVHVEHFGYPRVLGVRWRGFNLRTAGVLCDACRERERWVPNPDGTVWIAIPVELGPRMLGRRALGAIIAAAAAAVVTTAVVLVVNPPDLIPSGVDPGQFSSGTPPARSPAPEKADTIPTEPDTPRASGTGRASQGVVVSRAALSSSHRASTQVVVARGRGARGVQRAAYVGASRPIVSAQSP